MDDDDYELDYESYDSEDSNGEFELQNLYYNAKALKDNSLSEAIGDFKKLIETEKNLEEVDDYEYGFKAHKQICKCYFKLKDYENFLIVYAEILKYGDGRKVSRKYFEDSIRKILNYRSGWASSSFF